MTDLIMQLGGVIQRDVDVLKDVAQNVANANTPGYKATRVFSVMSNAAMTAAPQGLETVQTQASLKTGGGAMQLSGRYTDMSLSGDAWFVLQTPQGPRLTRDGRFQVNAEGELVSASGFRVLGQDGALAVGQRVFRVDEAGTLLVDERAIGQLKLVRAPDATAIQPMGNGLYATSQPLLAAEGFRVHQGVQERSNVDLSADMVRIMEVSRHVESVQRALSAYDGMLNVGINQLGKD